MKVKEKESPVFKTAELKVLDLIWCGAVSWFVQVTLVPVAMVKFWGLKAKPFIAIAMVVWTVVDGVTTAGGVEGRVSIGGGVVVGVAGVELELLIISQPMIMIITATTIQTIVFVFIIISLPLFSEVIVKF